MADLPGFSCKPRLRRIRAGGDDAGADFVMKLVGDSSGRDQEICVSRRE